jgi:hypothetical protein
MEPQGPTNLDELERVARAIVEDGLASNELVLALDQLNADRTNGESLEDASERLRRALMN